MRVYRTGVATTVVTLLAAFGGTAAVPPSAAARVAGPAAAAVVQPPPPVGASSFPLEPAGVAPVNGDGLIPNPATPTGVPFAAPGTCSVTFSATAGATSATVNAWIAANQNTLVGPTVVCLSGTFTDPLHIWAKTSTSVLELAPAPGQSATLDLGTATAADVNPNEYWGVAGGVSIVDSRSVEVYGLTIENYTFDGTAQSPAGIVVSTRSDKKASKKGKVPHLSACFADGGACGDIYLLDNTISDITNRADQDHSSQSDCNNQNVNAYGIAVIAGGKTTSQKLQHLVVEGNTVTGTRTGQSETVTFNGAVEDFLAADNVIGDADNIGLDTIGWETGKVQASHGYVVGNTVYDVDTESNAAYGKWSAQSGTCNPLPENTAGLYDDGASYIWFDANTVWNCDQGINLDVETRGKSTDHLLVTDNTVHQDPGTSATDPSTGTEPPGISGTSTVAGHDPYALYIDAFGKRATITDVYVHDNDFDNESQWYLEPSWGMPVVDLGGRWSNVEIWHNTISGLGGTDRYNPLLEVNQPPLKGGADTIDCNAYDNLSTATNSVNGNFALPKDSWTTLAEWQANNGFGWDAHSATGGFSPSCPPVSQS